MNGRWSCAAGDVEIYIRFFGCVEPFRKCLKCKWRIKGQHLHNRSWINDESNRFDSTTSESMIQMFTTFQDGRNQSRIYENWSARRAEGRRSGRENKFCERWIWNHIQRELEMCVRELEKNKMSHSLRRRSLYDFLYENMVRFDVRFRYLKIHTRSVTRHFQNRLTS